MEKHPPRKPTAKKAPTHKAVKNAVVESPFSRGIETAKRLHRERKRKERDATVQWLASLVPRFSFGGGKQYWESRTDLAETLAMEFEKRADDHETAKLKALQTIQWIQECPEPCANHAVESLLVQPARDEVNTQTQLEKAERKKADGWRCLAHLEPTEANCDERFQIATEHINFLLVRATAWQAQLRQVSGLFQQLHQGLHDLAAGGNQQAAEVLASDLRRAVWKFDGLATHKPELFSEWARLQFGIPGIISRNRERTAGNQTLLEKLKEGEGFPLPILPTGKRGKRLKLKDRAPALAMRLVQFICPAIARFIESQARAVDFVPPNWIHDAAQLGPFSRKTWPAWAKVAWLVLAETSPNNLPGLHPVFHDRNTAICNVRKARRDPYFGKNSNAPSIAEHDIKEALFGAFELIATGESRRTKERRKRAQ